MSDTKHTPGPWRFYNGKGEVHDANNNVVCKVQGGGNFYCPNGELIAAAPEMLEILRECFHVIAYSEETKALPLVQKTIDIIRKAKGE